MAAGTNGPTTYEADCTTALQAGVVAPFIQGLDVNGAPDPSFPTGATFGASGAASSTLIGPVVAGIEQALPSPNLGVALNETVGSTDGTATGTFSYVHDFGTEAAAPARQVTGVSWTSGSTTLTAAPGAFNPVTDVGLFVAGPTGGGINPQSTITAVAADGSNVTISIATTAAAGPVNIGLGRTITRADPAFSTGNVFTTNGVNGGRANIGVIAVNSVTVHALIDIAFGANGSGTGTNNCLLTGFDAANNPGPAQTGALTPQLPPGTTTPLVAASGGFITQPNTAQAITPAAAAFVNLVDQGPVTTDASATIDRNVSNTTTLTLPATDTDPTPLASCSAGSPSDPRLTVSISNSPTPCVATLTDSGGASTGATVTFPFTATDTAGNPSTPPGGSTVTVNIVPVPPPPVADGALNVIVGNVRSAASGKTFVGKVTNTGTTTFTVSDTDISNSVTVNGAPTTGSIAPLNPGSASLGPGASKRFRFRWTYGVGEVTPGATVVFTGTVNIPGDPTPADNTDMETRIAK